MFNNLPTLKRSILTVFRESVAIPFFFFAVTIQGTTALVIDENGALHFKPARIVREPEVGAVIDGEFIPGDGPGSILRCYKQEFVIHIEDIESLLNPATTAVADGDRVVPLEHGSTAHTVVIGEVSKTRTRLALPFWVGALLINGTTCIHIDDNGRFEFKSGKMEREPELGMVVDKDFKKASGRGSLYEKFGSTIALSKKGMEGLWNPATSEILREVDDAESRGEAVGMTDGGYEAVYVRPSTIVNVGRLSDYQPFAMLDGTSSRKQMNTAYEARSKFKDKSSLGRIVGLLLAFMLGAMSPRLNGLGTGGGGGGDFSAPVQAPNMLFDPDMATMAIDLATSGVLT